MSARFGMDGDRELHGARGSLPERGLGYLIGTAYLIFCLWSVATSVLQMAQQNELVPQWPGRPIGGRHSVTLEFTARTRVLGKLYLHVPVDELERGRRERLVIELINPIDRAVLRAHTGPLADLMSPGDAALVYAPGWPLMKGARYGLRFSLPDMAAGTGLRFGTSLTAENWGDRLLLDGIERPGLTMNYLILGEREALPFGLLLMGGVLLVGALRQAPANGCGMAVLLVTGVAAVLSEAVWERQLWGFWGEYWPDRYPAMAHRIFLWLSGSSTFSKVLDAVAHNRNGHNFLVPTLLAVLHLFGVPYILGYMAVSVAGSMGTLAVLGTVGRRHWRLTNEQCAWLVVLAGTHVALVRGFARPLTDGIGAFFTTLFVAAFSRASRSRSWRDPWLWVAVLAACLGVLARVALVPLLAVPLAVLVWRVFLGERHGRDTWFAPVMVSVFSAGLLVSTLSGLRLWGAVMAAWRFSATPEFRALFSIPRFLLFTVIGLQWAVPMAVLRGRRLLTDERTIPLWVTILGFEAMLFLGHIAPWLRYWTPVAPLGAAVTAILLFDRPGLRPRHFAVLGFSVAANLIMCCLLGRGDMY